MLLDLLSCGAQESRGVHKGALRFESQLVERCVANQPIGATLECEADQSLTLLSGVANYFDIILAVFLHGNCD